MQNLNDILSVKAIPNTKDIVVLREGKDGTFPSLNRLYSAIVRNGKVLKLSDKLVNGKFTSIVDHMKYLQQQGLNVSYISM